MINLIFPLSIKWGGAGERQNLKTMKFLLLTLATLYMLHSYSQQPLRIGDSLPPMQWSLLQNENISVANSEQYKNDLLILDCWATWCSSCYKNILKLDSLKQFFPSGTQILLVSSTINGDNEATVHRFIDKHFTQQGRRFPFQTIINDTTIATLFPFKVIPHYIWLYKNKVVAITGSKFITIQNMRAIIEENKNKPIKE